jgi:hypothetical protein
MARLERSPIGPKQARRRPFFYHHVRPSFRKRVGNMTSNTVQAILLVLCAAIMNAAYALPMKLNKKWQWEHSWFAFSVLGVAVVPTVIALLTVPQLWSTYATISIGTLAAMVLFGASWGVSLVFFGLALTRLGLAITFAVCLGTSAAVGALTPLIAQHADLVMTRQGGLIILGVLVIILGVSLCGLAGKHREAALQLATTNVRQGFWGGFLLAFTSGILGSMLNLGLAFGGSIQRAAQQHGASLAMMSNAVWLPLCRFFARSSLLLHPDAKKWQCQSTSTGWHLVLLADRRQHGTPLVRQYYSLQHLNYQTWRPGNFDRLALVSCFHRGSEHDLWCANWRMGPDRHSSNPDNDCGS